MYMCIFGCYSDFNTLSQVSAAEGDFLGFSLSIIVIFGLSFLAASFILYPVTEKASKVTTLLC